MLLCCRTAQQARFGKAMDVAARYTGVASNKGCFAGANAVPGGIADCGCKVVSGSANRRGFICVDLTQWAKHAIACGTPSPSLFIVVILHTHQRMSAAKAVQYSSSAVLGACSHVSTTHTTMMHVLAGAHS